VTTAAPITTPAPAFKEWAAIVHALLEGEQIVDLRKGGIREDGRHFELPARRMWLYPTAEHQRAELLKPAYRHWVDLATARQKLNRAQTGFLDQLEQILS